MKEAKAYIESGILELYVLGQLNAIEQKEVEAMATKFPEIKAEIEAIEFAMEQYALQHSIAPPEGLDQKIFESIGDAKTTSPLVGTQFNDPKVITFPNVEYDSKIRTLRFALAACIALLIISTIALYSAHNKLNTAQNQITTLALEKQKFTATVDYMKKSNQDLQKIIDMPDDPSWAMVKLAGTETNPKARMVVYWNKKSSAVMVDHSKMALPANDAGHQYQLWALVNGKPVDLGVFDRGTDTSPILLKMKNIPFAQAFAVTLEKRGGSASPTMNQMVVMGGISI